MEIYGLKHKMGYWSPVRWGSLCVKPLWDVILEESLNFASSHPGFEDALASLLSLFQNSQVAFPPTSGCDEPKRLVSFAALYKSLPHGVLGKLYW